VLQNGIEQVDQVAPLAPGGEVLPAAVWFPSTVVAPGHVRVRAAPRIAVPDTTGGRMAAALLEGSGCSVDIVQDFTTQAWRKLVANAVAGLMVLARRPSAIFRDDEVARLAMAYARECIAVGRAEGAALGDDDAEAIAMDLAATSANHKTSMLVDAEAGRPLEWDVRNGVIRRRAARHGLPTPISDVLVPLLAVADPEWRVPIIRAG
jgi:2-dehydropantoate 2-reductase